MTQEKNYNIKELSISNPKTGKAVSLTGGLVELKYYESILSNHITASLILGDTGNTIDKKSLLDGLPVRGGEPVRITMTDSQDNKLSFVGKENAFYVNRVRNGTIDTTTSIITLDLCTKEHLANEQSRVVKRYSGKISESVKKILKNVLKTNKPQDIEETSNSYNFIGTIKKPFYTITWLASKCIPSGKSYGKTAGFFFFETQEGFQFKSIETLVGPTKGGGSADSKNAPKYQFTNLLTTKEGFSKIIKWNLNQNIDVQEKLAVGAYNTRFLFFNPFTFEVKHKDFSLVDDQKGGKVESAGTELDFVAEEFLQGNTRGLSAVLDVGTLPNGINGLKQLATWKFNKNATNDKVVDRTVQANTRYNQLFSISIDILIEGNYSFKAGDTIYCEFPDVAAETKDVNPQTSGLYVIASLCHKVTASKTYTSMNLIRDSFGKKRG